MAKDISTRRIEVGDSVYSFTRKTDGVIIGIKEYLNKWHRYQCTVTVKFNEGDVGYFHADRLVLI